MDEGESKIYSDQIIILIFGLIVLVLNFPSLFLYFNYYRENKNTTLIINPESGKITITQKGIAKDYTKDDIDTSILNLGIYYKNAVDNAGRLRASFSNYLYLDVIFKNGDRYYISNLIVDFLKEEDLLIKETKYRFRLFPYIDKLSNKRGIDLNRKKK
jgi:hypothetical protein